jgi:hypothetical protein
VHFKNKEKGMGEDILGNQFTERYENGGCRRVRSRKGRFFEESVVC